MEDKSKQTNVWVFGTVALLRIAQLFIDQNYDKPDEHWQGPQVAFKIANGYGYQSWEWTISQPIRNSIYQLYLSFGYISANYLVLTQWETEIAVKLMQIILACLCDWYLLKIARMYIENASFTTYLIMLTNWFYFSMLNRTYINSAQTSLTVIAFYYWKAHLTNSSKFDDFKSRLIVGLCFIVRPTSILIWSIVWPYELIMKANGKIKFIFQNGLQIVLMLAASVFFNTYWYGKLTFAEFNFFKYNILMKWSEFYGIHSFFYYFYATIPLILGVYTIPLIIALFCCLRSAYLKLKGQASLSLMRLSTIVLLTLMLLSFSTHKQHRFLLVLTPFLMVLCAYGLEIIKKSRFLIITIVVINLLFFSFNIYGKTGGHQILRVINQDINKYPRQAEANMYVIYLCEPHALPLFSILQKNITARILDTSPMRKLQNFDEQMELTNNPERQYNILAQGVNDRSIVYLIAQQKYVVENGHYRTGYQFLLKSNYKLIQTFRNVNIWEQFTIGYDGFILLKKG